MTTRLSLVRLGMTGLALAVATTAAAFADGIDRNGDGRYSLTELRAFYPTLSTRAFRAMDENGDGVVSPGEFRLGQDEGLLPETTAADS